MIPTTLTIAGSDPSGGAGIQADLKTFSALGCYGASVSTALTAQNTRGVQGVFIIPPEFIAQQMRSIFDDLNVNALKTGMLANVATIEMVAQLLQQYAPTHYVLDPVMVSQSGHKLLEDDAIAAIRTNLFPLSTLITPNLPEAAAFLGTNEAHNEDEMKTQATALLNMGARAVLLKGGHGTGAYSVDVLATSHGCTALSAERINTPNTHGTGCTLSAAITAFLAQGEPLPKAVELAKFYLTDALAAGRNLHIGAGAGPVHHFFDLWNKEPPQ